jgi:hypothetical protein
MTDGQRVKIVCTVEPETDDWPPVATEGVWARALGNDEYELDNVPWFARGLAFCARVRADNDDDGVLVVRERIAWSGRYTIRVIPLGEAPALDQIREVVDAFSQLGVECEGALPSFKLVALDIPPSADLKAIKSRLREGEVDGRWSYEEGCVDERWNAI